MGGDTAAHHRRPIAFVRNGRASGAVGRHVSTPIPDPRPLIWEMLLMESLSEDPTYLAGGLGLVALMLLVALRVTQQGRYLIRALIVLGLAAAVLVIEHFWFTDAERIEGVVYD